MDEERETYERGGGGGALGVSRNDTLKFVPRGKFNE